MAAMAPWMWFLGFGALVALAILEPGNPILLIIVIFAGYQSWHRWQQRQHTLAGAGRLLPRRPPQPGDRRRGLHRADRVARVRDVRDAHPDLGRPFVRLYLIVSLAPRCSSSRRQRAARSATSSSSLPGSSRPSFLTYRRASRTARSISRLDSRSRIAWRLSYRSLPRASAISTLACEPAK